MNDNSTPGFITKHEGGKTYVKYKPTCPVHGNTMEMDPLVTPPRILWTCRRLGDGCETCIHNEEVPWILIGNAN